LPLHPTVYAEMLANKMAKHKAHAWLINTGWSGGSYGTGKRMSLKYTRAIIDAIHSGELEKVPTQKMDTFELMVPESCPGVPTELLMPKTSWLNKNQYDDTLKNLAQKFSKNFKKYEDKASKDILSAGPKS
jgi:phosphoenolpyruvate carboxykinase (ATP)